MKDEFDNSTGLSWLWALLFGPIYFAAHGFWPRAAVALGLGLTVVGILAWPFMAYPAWRKRAAETRAARADRDRAEALQAATLAALARIEQQGSDRR